MALINCPKCNKEISDTTKKCIHCKAKIKSNNNTVKFNYKIIIPLLIIVLLLLIPFIAYKIRQNRVNYNYNKQDKVVIDANEYGSCPSGYTLNGNKCEK